MAPNHNSLNWLIHCYPPREESAQKEERSASILRHKFQKHPLTPQFCAAVLGPRFAHEIIIFFKSGNATCEKYVWKSILCTFKIYLKIDHFLGTVLLWTCILVSSYFNTLILSFWFLFRFAIIAGDISPIDVISHVPVLCEDSKVPYIYVPSKLVCTSSVLDRILSLKASKLVWEESKIKTKGKKVAKHSIKLAWQKFP